LEKWNVAMTVGMNEVMAPALVLVMMMRLERLWSVYDPANLGVRTVKLTRGARSCSQ